MKKKYWIILICAVLLAVLFVPVPRSPYRDGGTREYCALTYKIVDWNRLTGDGVYDQTKVYFFPNNFNSIDSLWYEEEDEVGNTFIATIVEWGDTSVTVQPAAESAILSSSDRITFGTQGLEKIGAVVGSVVKITYTGGIMETYPAQIQVKSWELSGDLRHIEYTEPWLNQETAEICENNIFGHIVITQIYSNCFFAKPVIPMPYTIKLNGTLSKDWCVGDQILCTYENTYYDQKNDRVEADMLSVQASDWQPEPGACYKPVIYLYPETKTEVAVELLLDGRLTCTYPSYQNGWKVTAAPDGTLTDANGQTYNYLYWEGETNAQWDMRQGFCVPGKDTAAFLEDALEKLGLNRQEANEFIVYWLPLMQDNPYNLISFQTEAYTQAAQLTVSPAPDTVIRVFMTWKPSEAYVGLTPQELTAPKRAGFTVVEWGGTEVN